MREQWTIETSGERELGRPVLAAHDDVCICVCVLYMYIYARVD